MSFCFETPALVVRELARDDVPALQALFEAWPDYFVQVNGVPPRPDEAQAEFDELPPPHLSHGRRWFCGVHDRQGRLQGVLVVVADLAAPGVWHIALLFLAGSLRGAGVAAPLHAALQAWAQAAGAQWLRLGVVAGNTVAQRFWARCGYQPVRSRPMVNAAGEAKTVWVLVKPLAGGSLVDYLAQVPRDDPASTLP